VDDLQGRLLDILGQAGGVDVVLGHDRVGVAHQQARQLEAHAVLDGLQSEAMPQPVERNGPGQAGGLADDPQVSDDRIPE
jgi:hypothetical protein